MSSASWRYDMVTVSIGDLKERIDDLLADVEERGETVEIAREGEIVARLSPTTIRPVAMSEEDAEAFWTAWTALAERIGEHWPEGVSAVAAVNDVRRDL